MEIAMIHVRHLSELATWQFREFHGTRWVLWPKTNVGYRGVGFLCTRHWFREFHGMRWVLWPKTNVGCIKTQHPCSIPLTLSDSEGQIGSAYSESTSSGKTVSSRSFFCGFLRDTVMVLTSSLHALNRTQTALGATGRYTLVAPSNSHRKWFT